MEINNSEVKDIKNITNVMNENVNTISNQNQTQDNNINLHKKNDSVLLPMNINIKNSQNKIEEENGTQIQFLSNKQEQEKNETIYELNKSLEKTDDTSKNSFKIGEGQNAPNQQNESFFQKTKRWAGTAWSYINIANYFPKTEYKEYRNANGDWVKIPKKKIPLKKKKVEETDEEHIINKTFDRDRENLTFMTLDKIPIPNFG